MAIVCTSSFFLPSVAAEATSRNIGEPGGEDCSYEWWGTENPELNPNGMYAYYVDYGPAISDVTGWHNTSTVGDKSANSHMAVFAGDSSIRNLYGGYSTNGDANNNVAIIYSGVVEGNFTGGYAHSTGTANGNKIIVYGGEFTGAIDEKAVSGGQGLFANENVVTVYGGNFSNEINGGVVMSSGGKAINNTVVLAGNFSGTPAVWGGNVGDPSYEAVDIVTGNTLEVRAKNLTVSNVGNFENYYFILPAGIKSGDATLTVTGGVATDFSMKANIGVAMAPGAKLNKGDKVTLIRNSNGFTGNGYQQVSLADRTLKGTGGISLKYEFALSDTPTTIDATVTSVSVNEQAKAIVETRAASVGIANAGADLVAGQAMRNALANTSAKRGMSAGDGTDDFVIAPFFAVSGGMQRIESGSHTDVNGIATVLGLAARKDFDAFAFTSSAFFEFGTTHFSTHDSFAAGDVDGKGHTGYKGGGLLAHLDVRQSMLKDMYFEGAFRFGGMQSDWHSGDLRDAVTGRRASYDMDSPYIGAHVGLGYVWQALDSLKLDSYGKWFWTRIYDDDARVADDPYVFDDVDSYRLRFGMRADWDISERFGVYAGAAWEHESGGKARAMVYGFDVPSPSIRGNTGIFDFGFSLKSNAVPGLTIELGGTATAGVRQGIMGNLIVRYEF